MKKQFKRIVAMISALAMIVTGLAFSPASTNAATWKQLTPGAKNYEGIWTIEPVKHVEKGQETDWAQAQVDTDTTGAVKGLDFKQTGYSWNGTILNTSDIRGLYNLDPDKEYTMTLKIDAALDESGKDLYIGAKTSGGVTNMDEQVKSVRSEGSFEFTSTVQVKSGTGSLKEFKLYVYYGANCIHQGGYGDGALTGEMVIDSLKFTDPSGETTTVDPTEWNHVPTTDDPDLYPKNYVPESGSPWTLNSNNDGVNTWGNQDCKIDPDATGLSRLHIRKNYGDGGAGGEDGQGNKNDWWWDSASLFGCGKAVTTEEGTTSGLFNLTDGEVYTAQITVNSTKATGTYENEETHEQVVHKFRSVVFGNEVNSSLNEGTTVIDVPQFKFNSAENNDIRFVYVELQESTEFYIESITFTNVNDGWHKAEQNNKDFKPANSDWSMYVLNNSQTEPDPQKKTWGDIRYKYDDSAVGGIIMKPMATTFEADDPEHFYWNTATLDDYLGSQSLAAGTYSATISYDYTRPASSEEFGSPQLRYVFNGGDVTDVAVTNDGENTIEIEEFDYSPSDTGNIMFEFDRLEAGSIFKVNSITFTPVTSEWTRVPDEVGADVDVTYDTSMTRTGTVIRTWNLFAGYWGGAGCKLYYHKKEAGQEKDPLTVKIGAGDRWDPASAMVRINNTEAYEELTDKTNYYMTYSFTSTQTGTVHINQEGYEPTQVQRLDITEDMKGDDGLYHVSYKKIFTYLEENNFDGDNPNRITMFLTSTTYEYDENGNIVMVDDPEHPGQQKPKVIDDPGAKPLPKDTILSDFTLTYSRQDDDGWTLVTDSRGSSAQKYDDIAKDSEQNTIMQAYANSFYKGRLSYLPTYNEDGEDNIAQMGIRLDQTSGDFGDLEDPSNPWPAHIRIPNKYFYNRTDTNGNPLVNGRTYKLRFYFNSTAATPENKGLVFVQQGYNLNKPARYPVVEGENMLGGQISKKSGYTTHDDYNKEGGIEFVYNAEKTTTEQEYNTHVQLDFSEIPSGAKITNISWEFYAPGYDVYIDGTKNNTERITEDAGHNTYVFPSNSTQGFENVVQYVSVDDPTKTYTPGQQISFSDFNGADIKVNTVRKYKVTIDGVLDKEVLAGGTYTFPTSDVVDHYTDGTNNYQPGSSIQNVNSDLAFTSVLKNAYKVTIKHLDTGDTLQTGSALPGEKYTLPQIDGIGDYTYNGQKYAPGTQIGPFDSDVEVIANPLRTITIVEYGTGTELKTAQVNNGTKYQLPVIANIESYEYDGNPYVAGEEIGPLTQDVTVIAYPIEKWNITIDGEPYKTVDDGGDFSLPSGDTAAKIGYIDVDGGDILPPGTQFTDVHSDMDFLSVDKVEVNELAGAAMYFKQPADPNEKDIRGIRFGADFGIKTQKGVTLDKQTYANVYKSASFKQGTLITTYEYYRDYFDENIDLEAVAKAQAEGKSNYIFNIMNNGTFASNEASNPCARYYAAIVNLKDENITRDYIARSYAYVQFASGQTSTVEYANVTPTRSIKQIAQTIKLPENEDEYNGYEDWERGIIDYCAAYEN